MQKQNSLECILFLWFLRFSWKFLGFRKPRCFLSSAPCKTSPSQPGISPYFEALPPASIFVSCHTALSVSLPFFFFFKGGERFFHFEPPQPLVKGSKLPTLLHLTLLLCLPSFFPPFCSFGVQRWKKWFCPKRSNLCIRKFSSNGWLAKLNGPQVLILCQALEFLLSPPLGFNSK